MKPKFPRIVLLLFLLIPEVIWGQGAIAYIENKGQWPSEVDFSCNLFGGKAFIEKQGITYHFFDLSSIQTAHSGIVPREDDVCTKGHVVKQRFHKANDHSVAFGSSLQKTYYNFFLHKNAEIASTRCRVFSSATQKDVYPGIDLIHYADEFNAKYDWIVSPGADPFKIQWSYEFADSVRLENGRILLFTSLGILYEQKPLCYQIVDGQKTIVRCDYSLQDGIFSFDFPNGFYQSIELVIDPVLIFSTYSGSFTDNFGMTATYDSEGNLYSGSTAFGQNYPISVGAYQTTWAGGDGGGLPGTDIAISKYAANGSEMLWSSFLGGANDEVPHSLICNDQDEVLLLGTTSSPAFPVTNSAFDTSFNDGNPFAPDGTGTDYVNGSDIVVARFSINGDQLLASTFIGGSGNDGVNTVPSLKFNYADEFRGEIDLDEAGNVLIASSTNSNNFPIVNGAISVAPAGMNACYIKLNEDLSDILYSTYLGSNGDDVGNSVCIGPNNTVYLCGGTTGANFNSTASGYQPNYAGGTADGWILRLSEANGIESASYFGSATYDQLYFVEMDDQNQVHVFGQTMAPNSTMVINALWSEPNSGMLVAKFNADLNEVIWSTVFGTGEGKPNLSPAAFTVDICGKIYLSGWGGNTNTAFNPNTDTTTGMTVTSDAQQSTTDGGDFYLLVMEEDASAITYATFFGGNISQEHVDGGTSRFDRKGIIYQSVCAGCGSNDDFPIFPPGAVVSATNNSGNCNNAVFKFDFQEPLTIADFSVPPVVCVNQPIQVDNTSTLGQTFEWDFGGLFSSSLFEPVYTFSNPGNYIIELVVNNPLTCNQTDTLRRNIEVVLPVVSFLPDVVACNGATVELGPESTTGAISFQWSPSSFLSNGNDPNPIFIPGTSTDYVLLVSRLGCVDTLFQSVEVVDIEVEAGEDLVLCEPGNVLVSATSSLENTFFVWSLEPDLNPVISSGLELNQLNFDLFSPTTIYVGATAQGCTAVDTVELQLVSFQTIIDGDFTACIGDTVPLSVVNPNSSFVYTWSPESLIISGQGSSSVEAVVNSTTVFTVTSETPQGCSAEDEVVVQVSLLGQEGIEASADPAIIVAGQSSQLLALPEGYSYFWSPSLYLNATNIENPVATPAQTTEYFVTVFDGECILRDSVVVQIVDFVCGPPSIYVPNAFTPNLDNRNEKLFVRALNIEELKFEIFNRWGEKVFETNSLFEGWDGYYKEKPVDPAVFVYYLEAVCPGGQTYFEKGNITVIR